MGRSPVLTQTDFLIAHTINLSERVKLKFDANFQNLFNQAAVTNVNELINNGDLHGKIPIDVFYKGGWNANSLLNAVGGTAPDRRVQYGLPNGYQGIRDVRLGMRLQF